MMDVAQLDRKINEDNILTRFRLATNYSTATMYIAQPDPAPISTHQY